jgi:hypothetical protein
VPSFASFNPCDHIRSEARSRPFLARQPRGASKDESPSSLVQPGYLKSTIQNFDASDEDFRNKRVLARIAPNKDIKISDRTDK